jgi:predicted amidohydrolase
MTRIALAQMVCEKAAIAQNLQQIADLLAEAEARGVDILALPEMCLTGYADPTRYLEAVLRLDGSEIDQLLAVSRPYAITALVGLIEHNPAAAKPFITHVVVRQGELLGVYRKVTIKDDEVAWFSPGHNIPDIPIFQAPTAAGNLTFGIAICADIDNEAVFATCRRGGAQIIFELAAPGLYGDQATRDWEAGYRWWEEKCRTQLGAYARTHDVWIAVATQAGRTIDEDFPGGAFLFAPDGTRVYTTADWSPGVVYLDFDFEQGQAELF